MCEPAHSIVQFPSDFDDSDLPFGDNINKETRLKSVIEKVGSWASKVGKWFHVSKMGAGHSAAIQAGYKGLRYLPFSTDYEGFWWKKRFAYDIFGLKEKDEAYEAAKKYHEMVCIGNIQKFRRFFETSLQKTDKLYGYLDKFLEFMLTQKGKNELYSRIKIILPNKRQLILNKAIDDSYKLDPIVRQRIIKATMGYTRRRNLFVPIWADDDDFWK